MTVQSQTPTITYEGNGNTTSFAYEFESIDSGDIYVEIDGVLATEGIEYELENYDEELGGDIVFEDPPGQGVVIRIFRRTPITQEVDYNDDVPFQAETHEAQLDKDTYILQEAIFGGRALNGPVNLATLQTSVEIEITNTAGDNATIVQWDCAGGYAGGFLGEITDSAPDDGATTTKPDGYVWFEIDGTVAPDNGITMSTTAINETIEVEDPANAFLYVGVLTESNYIRVKVQNETNVLDEEVLETATTALEQFWVRFDVTSGTPYTSEPTDQWLDGHEEFRTWGPYQNEVGSSTLVGTLRIAPDDGGGSPDEALEVTRSVTLTATVT